MSELLVKEDCVDSYWCPRCDELIIPTFEEICESCGTLALPFTLRPATSQERKLALTDEELEAEVRRRYENPKSSFYGKFMWAKALELTEGE